MKSAGKSLAAWLVRNDFFWAFIRSTFLKGALFMERERKKYEASRRMLPDQIFVDRALAEHCPDLIVRHGVFRGMRYPDVKSFGSALFPKLLGTYELEVHPLLERICQQPYTEIVNVGCAEGYYAVGLAMRIPGARVYAFDTNAEAIRVCQQMAVLNGVGERVILGAFCDPEVLKSFPFTGRGLVVCDCESYEKHLFTPEVVERLATHDVLVEVHDDVDINISTLLRNRFAPTHEIESIFSVDDIQKAKNYSYPELEKYDLASRKILLTEWRPHVMEWMFFTPKIPQSNFAPQQPQKPDTVIPEKLPIA